MTREDVFDIVAKKYQTKPVYKWMKFPKYAVFEHENEGKWLGILLAEFETEEEILDLLDKSYHLTK